jgi:hypothetical protein
MQQCGEEVNIAAIEMLDRDTTVGAELSYDVQSRPKEANFLWEALGVDYQL